ncbi:MAG: hypothetical protein R3F43_18125 [bacterium]
MLVVGDYATWFQGWALRAVQGARPDVALVFREAGGRGLAWTRLARHRPDRWACGRGGRRRRWASRGSSRGRGLCRPAARSRWRGGVGGHRRRRA